MKINITSSSSLRSNNKKIEVSSIDEAIKRLQTDKELVKSVIDEDYSSLYNNVPTDFVVKTYSYEEDCDFEIEVYDYYRE